MKNAKFYINAQTESEIEVLKCWSYLVPTPFLQGCCDLSKGCDLFLQWLINGAE